MTEDSELRTEAIKEIEAEGLVATTDVVLAWILGWRSHIRKDLKDLSQRG